MKTATLIELQAHLKALNLSNMARHLEVSLRQAKESGIDYDEFLLGLTGAGSAYLFPFISKLSIFPTIGPATAPPPFPASAMTTTA